MKKTQKLHIPIILWVLLEQEEEELTLQARTYKTDQ